MKRRSHLQARVLHGIAAAATVLTLAGLAPALGSEQTPNDDKRTSLARAAQPQAPGDKKPAAPAAEKKAKPRHELSGAELYSMHCMRCHPERYPNERTSAQWKTILMHMRVRANLPAEHARKVLKYLQDNSGY